MSASVGRARDRAEVHLDPVDRESTPAIIARTLRTAIARGDFPPGSQLAESGLAQQLGVSRGPLREAMQRLTQEGLLVSHRNRGLFVADLTIEAVEDMYVLRGPIEEAAVRRILELGEQSLAAAKLGVAVAEMARFADDPNGDDMADADMAFHRMLVDLAESPRLSRVHETVLVETSMCLRAMRGTYAPGEDRVSEHRRIAEAIGAGDREAALGALAEHMRDGLARLVDQ